MAILSCSACLACWINGRSLSDNRTSDGREFSLHYNFRVQRSVGKPLRFNRRRAASLFGRARIFFCFQLGDARGFQSQMGYARAEDGRRIDAACTSTLRMVKAAMKNREIEKGGELSDDEMTKLLQSLLKQRRDSIEQYEKGNRQDLADKERAEIAVIESYLPQAATREEIEKAVGEAIAETGASGMREMGAVMKNVQGRLAGRSADNRMISEIVKSRLGS